MKRGLSTSRPTKAQAKCLDAIKDDGCLCCHIDGMAYSQADIHHLKSGNIRRGHDYTLGLCPMHHRWDSTITPRLAAMGPSLADGSNLFHAHYGSDDFLLGEQNRRLGLEAIAA